MKKKIYKRDAKRLNEVLVCGNYHHLFITSHQSTICKGCLWREPIDPTTDKFILNNNKDEINCKNFKAVIEANK